MPALKDLSVTLDPIETSSNNNNHGKPSSSSTTGKNSSAALKKAKWHLGIRSQSKSQDIMNEVFKAMKELGMEWKYCNNSMYSVRARRKVSNSDRYVKIGLQLYQVDHRSYLLDFRNLNITDTSINHGLIDEQNKNKQQITWDFVDDNPTASSNLSSSSNIFSKFLSPQDSQDGDMSTSGTTNGVSEVMEFFEMAASLIRTLAPDSTPKTSVASSVQQAAPVS